MWSHWIPNTSWASTRAGCQRDTPTIPIKRCCNLVVRESLLSVWGRRGYSPFLSPPPLLHVLTYKCTGVLCYVLPLSFVDPRNPAVESPACLHFDACQELCLEYINNFRTQFNKLFPGRRRLFLTAPNEYGVEKFVCTTLRPTLLPHRWTRGSIASCFDYEACSDVQQSLHAQTERHCWNMLPTSNRSVSVPQESFQNKLREEGNEKLFSVP